MTSPGFDAEPLHPRVAYATAGSIGGLGVGKALAHALASFGLVTPEQGESLAPLLDFLGTIAGTFLAGYMPRVR